MIKFILCANEFLSILNFPKPLVILKRFDNEMDSHEKDLIDDILKEQKWIK